MYATTTAPITRQAVAAALAEARRKAADSRRWLNAVNKASVELETQGWSFDGSTLVVSSRTTAGRRYTVTAAGCTCAAAGAGRACWHRAAYKLLLNAAALAAQSARKAAAQQAVDELFA
jgi:hypothetical protein